MTDETARTKGAPGTKTREYLRPMPATWWLRRKTYFLFMVRELTCLAVGGYAVLLLVLAASAHDRESFPLGLCVDERISIEQGSTCHRPAHGLVSQRHLVQPDAKVVVVWRGEERLNPLLIVGSNYLAWVIVSILIVWIVLR